MGLSVTHILLVLAIAVLLFGRGRIADLMGDVAKGIRSFKTGLAEDGGTDAPVPVRPAATGAGARDHAKAG